MPKSSITKEIDTRIIEQFEASPLCVLSLSSKELFHSNMLEFLFKRFPTLVNDFCKCHETGEVEVFREKDSIDITVKTPTEIFYIENKVKSIPNMEQLERYMEKKKSGLILLTLMEPTFTISNKPYKLRVVTYAKLAIMIRKIQTDDRYHKELIDDYLVLLSVLQEIADKVTTRSNTDPLFLNENIRKQLKSIRMDDIAQKIRFSSIVPYFKEACDNLYPDEISAGFSRSWALLNVKYNIDDYNIGIQIQEGYYRRFIESTNDASVSKIANTLKDRNLWFEGDFKQNKFNKFGKIFYYTKVRLSNKTIKELCEKIRIDGEYIRANEKRLKGILKAK